MSLSNFDICWSPGGEVCERRQNSELAWWTASLGRQSLSTHGDFLQWAISHMDNWNFSWPSTKVQHFIHFIIYGPLLCFPGPSPFLKSRYFFCFLSLLFLSTCLYSSSSHFPIGHSGYFLFFSSSPLFLKCFFMPLHSLSLPFHTPSFLSRIRSSSDLRGDFCAPAVL